MSSSRSVFISYSWGAEKRHPLVDELLAALDAKGIEVKRDSNAINYGDSIRAYMDELAAGRAIILVLSEEYFKSPNCMYELREIYLNSRKEFRKRIFPVVLKATKFHKTIDRIPYIRHWEEETEKLKSALETVARENIGTVSHNELRDYAAFRQIIDELLALIGDMNHLTEEEHLKTGFAALIERMFSQPEPDGGGGTDKTGHEKAVGNQSVDIDQNIVGNGNISSASGNVTIGNVTIYAAGTAPPPEKTDSPVSSAKPGTLFGVPNLPPNYLERDDDLKEVRAALFAKETRRQHVGVLGMGGLGKSVLAAALARDKDVRAAFPDGIFWLTFGQRPDEARLLELQAGILRHIPPGQQPEALDHGATLLSLALEDRRCLLIADDLWDSRHLRHFPLGGDGSRFLLTTRDAEVIRKIGAHRCQIGLLSDPQARKLLAECSGYDENALPDEAAVIVQECGHLPLAIAAVGSMVMDESADFWQIVLKRLQTARLDKIPANVTIDYDYDDLFKVFHISVDALPKEVQAYYKTLLVFPEDERILTSVLQLYWKHCHPSDYEPIEIISILVKRSLLSRVDDNLVALHDLLRDYLTYQYGGDVASLHKQLLDAYKSEYHGGWHTIPYEATDYMLSASGYFHRQWKNHARSSDDFDLECVIADSFIRNQSRRDIQNIRALLESVNYKFIDIAPHLLKTNKHPHVLSTCLNILGNEAKEDARRLLKESNQSDILIACLNLLYYEAKEDARRFLQEGQHPHVLTICLKILGWEAKDDAKRLLKENNNKEVITVCLQILGNEAKDDARRLLIESHDADVVATCINLLGDEVKEIARQMLKENHPPDVLSKCLNMLGDEAKEEARKLLRQSGNQNIIASCLKLLGDEGKEEAKRLLKESKNEHVLVYCLNLLGEEAKETARQMLKENHPPSVLCKCLNLLGEDTKDDARRLLKESKYSGVLTVCLNILGDEAKDDAKRLLKESKDEAIIKTCLYLLGNEAKKEARRLLKSSKDEIILIICIEILGKEAEADANRLIKTTKSRSIREGCQRLIFSWKNSLGSKFPELDRLKKNLEDE